MREVYESILEWKRGKRKIALATVVKVYGSAPRPIGSKMIVNDQMGFAGSVSGGCVEGNVIENALSVMKTGKNRLVHYGIVDDTAWDLGLACGGEIEVFIEMLHDPDSVDDKKEYIHSKSLQIILDQGVGTVVTILSGFYLGEKLLFSGGNYRSSLEQLLENDELREMTNTARVNLKPFKAQATLENELVDIFVDVIAAQPKLIIIGGVHIAIPLVQMANILDFYTVVLDSRSVFATKKRFHHANEIIVGWPAKKLQAYGINENTYVVFLSHDEKIDNPALKIALESNARYIGALGSRKTHQKRITSLTDMGVHRSTLERIHAPIGIKIGAFGAEQIALSIMTEIITVQNGVGWK